MKKNTLEKVRKTITALAAGGLLVLGSLFISRNIFKQNTAPHKNYDTTGVAALRTEFSKTQLGRDLLKVADNNNVTIYFDTMLLKNRPDVMGLFIGHAKELVLKRGAPYPQNIIDLAHELRHCWQYNVLDYSNYTNKALSPQELWAINRTIEADAFAFSAYFWADRMRTTGENFHIFNKGIKDVWLQNQLGLDIKEKIEKGLFNLTDYRNLVLQKCYATLNDRSYNPTGFEISQNIFKDCSKKINLIDSFYRAGNKDQAQKLTSTVVKCLAENTPSVEEVEQHIRKYGGISLDTTIKTSLQDPQISRYTLLKTYPQSFWSAAQREQNEKVIETHLSSGDSLYKSVFAKAQKYSQKARNAQIRRPY